MSDPLKYMIDWPRAESDPLNSMIDRRCAETEKDWEQYSAKRRRGRGRTTWWVLAMIAMNGLIGGGVAMLAQSWGASRSQAIGAVLGVAVMLVVIESAVAAMLAMLVKR